MTTISKFRIRDHSFHRFSVQGNVSTKDIDFQYYAGKGVGRIRIEPLPNTLVSCTFELRPTLLKQPSITEVEIPIYTSY